ncbi:hypothetical protein Tsubulata_042993 [Turnera subulata]|uniref:Uncharacterized protein n=1 Tax=Turnera subulata TaxID=218843 RepID=A0A9Q0GK42_9ROSI|nr:hypothetical protein Tsubulata_042993 [Turnera subulata]
MADDSIRRLPSWMVKPPPQSTSVPAANSSDSKPNILPPQQPGAGKKKRKTNPHHDTAPDKRSSRDERSVKKKGKATGRGRSSSSREVNDPSSLAVDDDDDDDDFDLTVDDLVSIAQEYVKAEADSAANRSLNQGCESGNIDTGNGLDHRIESTAKQSSDPSKGGEGGGCLVGEGRRTGDPAQDMLDLLLGPLLNKPVEEGKRTDLDIEDDASFFEFRNLRQNNLVLEEKVPLVVVKKKTSLKDKVSLLLD